MELKLKHPSSFYPFSWDYTLPSVVPLDLKISIFSLLDDLTL